MIGPGKYDEECTAVREQTGAKGVVLLVYGGSKGEGFSVQAPVPLLLTLPTLLRDMADSIERDMQPVRS